MERPTSVTVLGILNLGFGAFGILGVVGSTVILFGMNPSNPVYTVMQESKFYWIWTLVGSLRGLVFTFVLLAAGVGLLQSKPWGRTLSLVYGVYAIVFGLIGGLVNFVFLLLPLVRSPDLSDPTVAGALGGGIGGTIGACFGLIYPVALLYFLTRPPIREYFAAR